MASFYPTSVFGPSLAEVFAKRGITMEMIERILLTHNNKGGSMAENVVPNETPAFKELERRVGELEAVVSTLRWWFMAHTNIARPPNCFWCGVGVDHGGLPCPRSVPTCSEESK